METVTSLFSRAMGLKKTGDVGGGTTSRLTEGTTSLVLPSRYATVFIFALQRSAALLNDSTGDGTFIYLRSRERVGLGIWLLTGPPGVGKSTAVSKVVLGLKSAGVIVGGCTTSERREGGVRVGFNLKDLTSGRTGELASATSKIGPRVGRYRVNLADLSRIGAEGLTAAAATAEVIVIDEVGPMELVSPEFRRGIRGCIDSGKPMLAVVHERMEDDILSELKKRAAGVTTMSMENRDAVPDELGRALLEAAGGRKV